MTKVYKFANRKTNIYTTKLFSIIQNYNLFLVSFLTIPRVPLQMNRFRAINTSKYELIHIKGMQMHNGLIRCIDHLINNPSQFQYTTSPYITLLKYSMNILFLISNHMDFIVKATLTPSSTFLLTLPSFVFSHQHSICINSPKDV